MFILRVFIDSKVHDSCIWSIKNKLLNNFPRLNEKHYNVTMQIGTEIHFQEIEKYFPVQL